MSNLTLYDVIDGTYQSGPSKHITDKNYYYDNELSNDETSIYHNPIENKLLVGHRGTKTFDDVKTDAYLAVGNIRNSDRYKRSNNTYRLAKDKYKGSQTTTFGHSLGGSLASAIGDDEDTIITYNKGANPFLGNSTTNKKNETAYRQDGDLVSLFSKFNKNKSKTLRNNYFSLKNPLLSHDTKNIKNKNIYI